MGVSAVPQPVFWVLRIGRELAVSPATAVFLRSPLADQRALRLRRKAYTAETHDPTCRVAIGSERAVRKTMVMSLARGLACRVEMNRLGRMRKFAATLRSLVSDGGELL